MSLSSLQFCHIDGVTDSSEDEEEQASEHELTHRLCQVVNESVPVDEDEETQKERLKIESFVSKTCNCSLGVGKNPCSCQFSAEAITEQRQYCLSLERSQLDLVVLTHFQALGKDVSLPGKETRRTKYIEFCFKGKHVCRETFLFLYTLSLKRYRNLLEHFCKNGLVLRDHGNYRKAPHNRMAFDDVHAIVEFLKNLATTHALPLPG